MVNTASLSMITSRMVIIALMFPVNLSKDRSDCGCRALQRSWKMASTALQSRLLAFTIQELVKSFQCSAFIKKESLEYILFKSGTQQITQGVKKTKLIQKLKYNNKK